jgi:hypothetical protein
MITPRVDSEPANNPQRECRRSFAAALMTVGHEMVWLIVRKFRNLSSFY